MRFTADELESARRLKELGLEWEPIPGHFVLDPTGFCQQPSPFQERVYFILNYPYFMKAVGGVERFKEIMIWLPTWYDARQILAKLDVSDDEIAARLSEIGAIRAGTERLALYQIIEDCLVRSAEADGSPMV